MMYTVKTKISFEAAHRLYNVDTYSSECRDNLHGHSYKVEVTVGVDNLNPAGMVIDFKLLKKVIKDVIEDKYDHSCILRKSDSIASAIEENCKKVILVDESPTAEWMSKEFYEMIESKIHMFSSDLHVVSVGVQETENNIAYYFPED